MCGGFLSRRGGLKTRPTGFPVDYLGASETRRTGSHAEVQILTP